MAISIGRTFRPSWNGIFAAVQDIVTEPLRIFNSQVCITGNFSVKEGNDDLDPLIGFNIILFGIFGHSGIVGAAAIGFMIIFYCFCHKLAGFVGKAFKIIKFFRKVQSGKALEDNIQFIQADPAPSQEPSADYGTLQNDSAAKTDSSQGTETNSGAGTDSFQGTGTNSGAGAGSSQGTGAGSAAKTDSSQGTETNNGVGTGSFQGTGTNSGAGLGSSQGTGTNSGSGMGNVSGFGSAMGSGAGNFSAGFGSGYGVGGGINGGSGYAYAGSGEVALKTVKSAKASKSGWPGWAVVLLVVGLVFASPVIIGVVGTLIGVLASWICLILAFGLVTLALFLVFLVLAVVGIMCMFTDPVCGIALIGGGLLCAGIGILFLMLTVAMAGIVTPAIIRGIAYLLGWRRKK